MSEVRWLQKRSIRVARTLFASLPFSQRFSYAFAIISGVELQALGRSLGVIFIKKKVQGLPDIHGKPALEFPIDAHKDPTRLLPTNYLSDLASHLRLSLLQKYKSEQLVNTAVSTWLFHFVVEGAWKNMDEGVDLTKAKNYVLNGLERTVLTELRNGKRKKRDMGMSLDETNEEGDKLREPADTKSEAEFYHNMSVTDMPKVRRVLEHEVHPDAPLYLDLLMEGFNPAEILGFSGHKIMLPHFDAEKLKTPYKTWKRLYEPKIREVLLRFMSLHV